MLYCATIMLQIKKATNQKKLLNNQSRNKLSITL